MFERARTGLCFCRRRNSFFILHPKSLSTKLDHPDFEEALYSHMESVRYGADANKLIAKIKKALGLL